VSKEEEKKPEEVEKKKVVEVLFKELEEKKEEKPERPVDFLSGLFPMLVLPSIIPLLQQVITQTLASTTVNVKVESSTAIIPIEISASNVILPIEIRASTVTINVNIVGSTTINVNVTNSSLDVYIRNSTVKVEIVGTATVVVSGNVNIIIADQYTALRLRNVWEVEAGRGKIFHGEIESKGAMEYTYEQTVYSYTVPSGKTLYIESIIFSLDARTVSSMDNVYDSGASYVLECIANPTVVFRIYKGTTVIDMITLNGNKPSDIFMPITPLKYSEGETFKITVLSSGYGSWCVITANGYEI